MLDTLKTLRNLLLQRPVLAIFEINLQCNSQCGYCDLPLNKGRYELSRDEIKRIFTDLYRDGLRYVFIQGGEPTLRKDLISILEDLHKIGFKLSLITNGTRLTPDFVKQLSSLPVSISVSLDTLDRQHYKEIRGADQLKLVVNGIDALANYPHPKYLTCILSEKNKDDVLKVSEFAREKGFIPVVGAYHWNIDRYGKVDASLQYKNDVAAKVFEQILQSELVPAGYFRDYLNDNIKWLSGEKLEACDAGRYSIAIDSSGNVAPCLALEHGGNLLNQTLSEILGSMNKQKIEQCSESSSCNMMCSRVVGSSLRHPVKALLTPEHVDPQNV